MNSKDDNKKKDGTFLSSSQELFENIFKRATMEIRRKKAEKIQNQQPALAPAQGRRQHPEKLPATEKRAVKPAVPVPRKPQTVKRPLPVKTVRAGTSPRSTEERAESTPPAKSTPKTDKTNVKRSGAPKAALLLVLLAVLAGIVSNYVGIMDISLLFDYFGFGREQQVAQAPIPRKQPVKPPERPVTSPKQPQTQEKVSEPTPSVVSKEGKLAAIETPTTIAQATSDKERIEEKTPSASAQGQPVTTDKEWTRPPVKAGPT